MITYPAEIRNLIEHIKSLEIPNLDGHKNTYEIFKAAEKKILNTKNEEVIDWINTLKNLISKLNCEGKENYKKILRPDFIVVDTEPSPNDFGGSLVVDYTTSENPVINYISYYNNTLNTKDEIANHFSEIYWQETSIILNWLSNQLNLLFPEDTEKVKYFVSPNFALKKAMVKDFFCLEIDFFETNSKNLFSYSNTTNFDDLTKKLIMPITDTINYKSDVVFEGRNADLAYILRWLEHYGILEEASWSKAQKIGMFKCKPTKKPITENNLGVSIGKILHKTEVFKLIRNPISEEDYKNLPNNEGDKQQYFKFVNYQLAKIFKPDLIK